VSCPVEENGGNLKGDEARDGFRRRTDSRAALGPDRDLVDATSEVYYSQLVEEERILTVMADLWEVIETKWVFSRYDRNPRPAVIRFLMNRWSCSMMLFR
jgi:hypothetical protein